MLINHGGASLQLEEFMRLYAHRDVTDWHAANAPFHVVPVSIEHESGARYLVCSRNNTVMGSAPTQAGAQEVADRWNEIAAWRKLEVHTNSPPPISGR